MKNFWTLCFLSTLAVANPNPLFEKNIDKAFAAAMRTGKPMLIDFYGIWCPPCNQLDETVFVAPSFHQQAKSFQLLAVDADHPDSWKLKDRYKVGGYPTVLFTDAKGEELYRIVGYRGPEEFSRVMKFVLQAKGKNLKTACKSKNVDDLWRCAVSCMEKKDYVCGEAAFKKLDGKLQPKTARYELARSYMADRSETSDLKVKSYEALLKEYPESPMALIWGLSYWGAVSEQKVAAPNKELLEGVLKHYETSLTDPRREELGLPLSDMPQLKAQLLTVLGKTEEAKAAWASAATLLKQLGENLPAGMSDRGYVIERITALDMAGETDAAMALAKEYEAKYPKEFTFHFAAASILERKKKYNEALPLAQKAFENSYGDNRLRAATLLVTIYGANANKAEAKRIYQQVKGEIAPDTKLEVRTHRHIKRLDDVWSRVEKG